ncbi:TRAP transporter substrate-binding protein [Polaromonas sp. JS666]|uniref:TRAP transporter substrate-binding protein n=1 Tax=Polaromonas sp. (strain JS666 / ATCC BAA-500) TaxID=296591 RepID=UPI00005342ED|nr:TRAP transporter substrate-binding protein [Polaromonas sp. JS666]ABE44877.1 TRAP dicarboxylate transporter, DctP subunit [Polaromonas sp. JS666]
MRSSISRPGGWKVIRLVPAWAALALLALGSAFAEPLRVAGNFAANHSSSLAMAQFKLDVEKVSSGQIQVEVFPAMQLGSAQDNVDQVRSGKLFMTWISTAYLSRTVPELSVLSIPFLFTDRQLAFKVVDGKVGAMLGGKFAAKGFLPLGFMELGPRQLTNSQRPVRSITDLKGLKLRLQPDEIHIATFQALGANPVKMDIKEVYGALQSGALDAQENPFAVIRDRNFHEVQKYLTNTSHFFDFIVLVANKQRFEALKPEHQKIIQDAATKAVIAQRTSAAAEDIGAIVDLANRGMKFEPVRPSFRADMRKATEGIVDSVRQKAGADLVQATLDAAVR